MKTLAQPQDAEEIRRRLMTLTAEDTPLWGVMNVTQMVCHVREAYGLAVGEEPVVYYPFPLPAAIAKRMGLWVPVPWPHGVAAIPPLKVGGERMATTSFTADHAGLMEAFGGFCAESHLTKDHPYFRAMDHADWMRWGYLHADHHLRQFGR